MSSSSQHHQHQHHPQIGQSCCSSSLSSRSSPDHQLQQQQHLKGFTIKIPKGLRNILNDLTREVLSEAAEEVVTEADIHNFLADYLERKLTQRMEEEIRAEGHAQYATDSDSGVETGHHRLELQQNEEESQFLEAAVRNLETATLSDLSTSLANNSTDENAKKSQAKKAPTPPSSPTDLAVAPDPNTTTSIHQRKKRQCLKLEFTLLDQSKSDGDTKQQDKKSFATADLVLMTDTGKVEVTSIRRESEQSKKDESEEEAISVPIHLVAEERDEEESAILEELLARMRATKAATADHPPPTAATPMHSITSDLPPSPASLLSWQPPDEQGATAVARKDSSPLIRLPLPQTAKSKAAVPMITDLLSVACPGDNVRGGGMVAQDALLLKVASPPSPPLLPPFPMSPAAMAMGFVQKSSREVQTEERGGGGGEKKERDRKIEREVLSVGQQTATLEVSETGTQVEEEKTEGKVKKEEDEDSPPPPPVRTVEKGSKTVKPIKKEGTKGGVGRGVSLEQERVEGGGQSSAAKSGGGGGKRQKLRTHYRRSSWNPQGAATSSTSSSQEKKAVLTDASVQTEVAAHITEDDLVARVLLEHAGSAFDPPDPRRTTNYLDLSRIGEEGETPASDEIWLAVEDGDGEIDRGFLTSSDDEDGVADSSRDRGECGASIRRHHHQRIDVRSLPSTVETDKLSTAATMAGHVVDHPSTRPDREDDLDGLDEEAARSQEMYVGVAARLQGVLSEELLPIQDTLAVTEKSVVVLADKLQRMESVLQKLSDKIGSPKPNSDVRRRKIKTASSSSSSEEGGRRNISQILTRVEKLSDELISASTASKLRDDNDNLRQDLVQFRQREKFLLSRIEEMEKMILNVTNGSKKTLSRPSSSRRNSNGATVLEASRDFPPVAKPRESKTTIANSNNHSHKPPREEIEVGKAIKLLTASSKEEETFLPASSSDLLKASSSTSSEVQIARSDNAILRQDLQVCRERESQLVRRNRDLEDKLLLKRATYSKRRINGGGAAGVVVGISEVTSDSTSSDEHAKDSLPSSNSEAKTNRDLHVPGSDKGDSNITAEVAKAEERKEEKTAKQEEGDEGKVASPPVNQSPPEQKGKKEEAKISRHKRSSSRGNNVIKKQSTVVKASSSNSSSSEGQSPSSSSEEAKTEKLEDPPKVVKKEELTVTVSSKSHDLEVTSPTPQTVVVRRSKEVKVEKIVEKGKEEEAKVQPSPPAATAATKSKAQVVLPKQKSLPKKTKPPKLAPKTKQQTVPASTPKEPKTPPSSIIDARSDPIPKPSQYPAARPPRDYRAIESRSDVVDTASKKISDEKREADSAVGVVDMLVKEEPGQFDNGDVALSTQVRESPDGANSSVAGAPRGSCSRASNVTTVANIIDLDEEGEGEATVQGGGGGNNSDKNNIKVADTKTEDKKEEEGVDVHSAEGKSDNKKLSEAGEEEEERVKEKRDVMMDFVMMDLGSPSKRKKMPPPWLMGKRRPAVIRRVKKQRSRSLSTDKLNKLSEKSSSPKKRRRVRRSNKSDMFRSVERLPTLSPFDEERIIWMRNMEDDIQLEEERRSRCAFRKVEEERKASPTSSSSSSSATSVLYVQPPPPPPPKVARKQWDIDNMEKELKVPNNVNATPKKTPIKKPSPKRETVVKEKRNNNNNNKIVPQINVECFIVSRGWQLDQSRLLRALDSVDCANFGRVQVATTMSRLVESVRPHLDAVVVHLGSQELMDAAHSLAKKNNNNNNGGSSISRASLAESVAASIATVASRQLIKVASQNRDTHFVVSLPLPFPASTSSVGNSYEELRRAFNANLSANCSTAPNLHCTANEDLSTDVRYLSDAAAGPVGGLSSSGMRRLSRGWGEQLGRLARAADGRLMFRHVSSSDSGGSASSKNSSGSL